MSLLVSTARAVFFTSVGGGTVYGSIKAGVWSTDGNKPVETLRDVKLPPGILFHRDSQYTQQKVHETGASSGGGWSWGVLESVKAQWNRGVVTMTSALVNEHQQWNGLASWTSTQVKKINDYFKSPPTGQ